MVSCSLWAMETARDILLVPCVSGSKRGATAGGVTHESSSFRYSSEIESDTLGVGDGSTVTFVGGTAGKLANPPLRPLHCKGSGWSDSCCS